MNSARGTARGGSGEHGIPENGRLGDLGEDFSETILLKSLICDNNDLGEE